MPLDPMASWRARHFGAQNADSREASVRLEPDMLILTTGTELPRRWRLDDVLLVNKGGTAGPVQLEMRGERTEAVIVEGPGFLAALRAASGVRGLNRLGGNSGAVRFVLAIGALGVVTIVALWLWGIPTLAAFAAESVPPEWERRFGAMVVADMVKASERVSDPVVTVPVEQVFALLVAQAPRDSFDVIVAREKLVNAFAAPGGYVVVTTGLLGALNGPDELAGVLAHEITHVVERHSARQLFAKLGLRALIGIVLGDQGLSGTLGGAAGTLGELSNSRGDESEADAGAVRLLAKAGIDPRAADRALASIAESASGKHGVELAFLSTHPSTPERRAKVRRLAEAMAVPTTAALPDHDAWHAMRKAAGAAEGEGRDGER